MTDKIDISVIIPVSERYDDVGSLYRDYKAALADAGGNFEFVYVLDGDYPQVFDALRALQSSGERITIVKLAKWFGEATALTAGFEHSSGDIILTLPAYYQIEAADIPKVLGGLNAADMAVARRWPRLDSFINRIQAGVFHGLLRWISGYRFHDLGSGVRAMRRRVVDEVPVYGDQHRFLPMLVARQGFRVTEIDVAQSSRERGTRLYRPGVYIRRILDIFTVFFLVKFTKKPLRFFGLVGTGTFALGGVFLLYLIVERLIFGVPLADRPALLLSSLLVVLGVQIFAMGLIGELIIFTHAKEMKEYTVEQVVN